MTPTTDTIFFDSKDQRESFRYHFKTDQGFTIEFQGKKVMVLNISAGGISFYNEGFRQFDVDDITFTLDIPTMMKPPTFQVGLRILTLDQDNICHCIFERCTLEQHELIHKYVLEMQKNDLAH
ncbi:PilZ domain-containing protein [Desulfobacula sp.]|uniref:PilZ domain-containing protein n=1 Tax=Desulfobacula sp. TaxID=2593537 RepID=UPI00260D7AB2|nr:PilZ domain-containing protein [Desulfobacula sp.]